MPKTAKRKPATSVKSYQSRADLMAMLNKQAKTIAKLRAEQSTMPDPDDSDIEALPDVQLEGLPFRPSSQKTLKQGRATPEETLRAQLSDLLSGTITIHPTPYVRSLFAKPRRGLGGFQSLHAALQHRMGGTKTLGLSGKDFARVVNYSTNYGEGGFQQSLRWLVALWVAETMQTQGANQSL